MPWADSRPAQAGWWGEHASSTTVMRHAGWRQITMSGLDLWLVCHETWNQRFYGYSFLPHYSLTWLGTSLYSHHLKCWLQTQMSERVREMMLLQEVEQVTSVSYWRVCVLSKEHRIWSWSSSQLLPSAVVKSVSFKRNENPVFSYDISQLQNADSSFKEKNHCEGRGKGRRLFIIDYFIIWTMWIPYSKNKCKVLRTKYWPTLKNKF